MCPATNDIAANISNGTAAVSLVQMMLTQKVNLCFDTEFSRITIEEIGPEIYLVCNYQNRG